MPRCGPTTRRHAVRAVRYYHVGMDASKRVNRRIGILAMSEPDDHQTRRSDGLALESTRPRVDQPPLYKVVLLNDDFTPMDFVVDVLKKFFGMTHEKAVQIMLHVHTRGRGVAGVYTREIAETKAVMVTEYAREHEHPLQCTLEES